MKASNAVIQKMRAAASAAAEKAYCPYSKFPVGAAVLTEGVCGQRGLLPKYFGRRSKTRCRTRAISFAALANMPVIIALLVTS